MDNLTAMQQALRQEADTMLRQAGVLDTLAAFGTPHVAGSYALELMTWRDLDVYLEAESLGLDDFFRLGGELAQRLSPVRMHFRNERLAATPDLPRGLYWGIHLGDVSQGAWKIDLWALEPADVRRLLDQQWELAGRIGAEHREAILQIKHAVWRDPGYRHTFSSQDIYDAVLDQGVRTPERFKSYIQMR